MRSGHSKPPERGAFKGSLRSGGRKSALLNDRQKEGGKLSVVIFGGFRVEPVRIDEAQQRWLPGNHESGDVGMPSFDGQIKRGRMA